MSHFYFSHISYIQQAIPVSKLVSFPQICHDSNTLHSIVYMNDVDNGKNNYIRRFGM